MLRRLALSYWTPLILGVVLLGLHLAWAIRWEPTKRGEVVTGFGACLIVLGLLVAARPYVRAGLVGMARAQVPAPEYPGYFGGLVDIEAMRTDDIAKVEAAKVDVLAERVVGVLVIVVGTLLNGYGAPIARLFGLEG